MLVLGLVQGPKVVVCSGILQVTLEYWGPGSAVRLAGSFNGWQHHVPLRPDPSSEIPGADGSR